MMSEPSSVEKMKPLPGVGVNAVFVAADPQKAPTSSSPTASGAS
jgi:hypothetical protein